MSRSNTHPGQLRAIKECEKYTDVYGILYIARMSLNVLPYNVPHEVKLFACNNNRLRSLFGSPRIVSGGVDCSNNKLDNLHGSPRYVKGSMHCTGNPLTSLEGAPDVIEGQFYSDQFTDADYRKFVEKRKCMQGSQDEAGLGDMLDVI